MDWTEIKNQRDANGELTDLALAVDALEDNGCDCGTDESGTCLACRCEAAIKHLWEQQVAAHRSACNQRTEKERTERELARAHAAIRWFATVRAAIASGALRAADEDAYRGFVNILAVAHALTEVWLSGEKVTARAVAELLGWHAEHSALAVREWLRPLQTGPYPPPLVLEDLRPNIEV